MLIRPLYEIVSSTWSRSAVSFANVIEDMRVKFRSEINILFSGFAQPANIIAFAQMRKPNPKTVDRGVENRVCYHTFAHESLSITRRLLDDERV